MHGKTTFKKTIQRATRTTAKTSSRSTSYLEIGSWRFEENEDGDLIIWNLETDQKIILARKEEVRVSSEPVLKEPKENETL